LENWRQAAIRGIPVSGEARPQRQGETFRAFGIAILIALGVRTFVVEPFKIPSGSMIPTLLVGDYILVNKFSYGIRMPFSGEVVIPIGKPTRGDVVVFRYPDDPRIDYIKRVVGLPGDEVRVAGDQVWVNGQQLDHRSEAGFSVQNYRNGMSEAKDRYVERNIEGDEYTIIHEKRTTPVRYEPLFESAREWDVPEGCYFMMGDNRDNSRDSRKWDNPFVTMDQLKGRAFMVHWSWVVGDGTSGDNFVADLFQTLWRLVTFQVEEIRWERVGRKIDGTADP